MPSRRKRPAGGTPRALWLILAAALALRLWGIADRLPDPSLGINPMDDTAVDETDRRGMRYSWEMWRGGTGALDLNPGTGDWPGLSFYVTLAIQVLYKLYWTSAHAGADAEAFARHVQADPAALYLFARVVNAIVGVLTVLLTYRAGSRLAGHGVGLIAALLLAVNPFHILVSQRVSDPNLMSLFFLLLATLFLLRFAEAPDPRRSAGAGAMIGLAGACKYVPMVALVALVFAHFDGSRRAWGRAGPPGRAGRAGRLRSLLAGIGACGAAFFLASPFTLLDWKAKTVDFALQRGRLLGDWVGQSQFPIALPTYLIRTLPDMLGWPAYLLAVPGMVILWRLGAAGRIVALIPLALVVPNGLLALAQGRFVLPALGILEVAAALSLTRGAAWARGRVPASAASIGAAAVAGIALAWPAPSLLATRAALHAQDSRHVALRWIEASIPPAEPMGFDLYGPVLRLGPKERSAVVWPFLAAQSPLVRTAYHPEWLDGLTYYVTSSEVTDRFDAARERYPLEANFYRWIRERGQRVWTSKSPGVSGPTVEVWALPQGFSTREERERLWSRTGRDSAYTVRVARWCSEMAQVYLWRDDYPRAKEWAVRGLSFGPSAASARLLEVRALAELRLGNPAAAESTAREGLAAHPDSPLLHVYRAMALEVLGKRGEALAEYRAALPFCPNENAAAAVRAAIARLEAGEG